MSLFTQFHRRALEDAGYTVFAPDEDPLINLPSAVAFVRAAGHVVIRAHEPPDPHVGECWVPTRKEAVQRGIKSRWITYNDGDLMMYRFDGERHTQEAITLASWHRWVRRTRAVRG